MYSSTKTPNLGTPQTYLPEAVLLLVEALPLDDQPHRARRPLRRVRDPARQQEQLALLDHHVPERELEWDRTTLLGFML